MRKPRGQTRLRIAVGCFVVMTLSVPASGEGQQSTPPVSLESIIAALQQSSQPTLLIRSVNLAVDTPPTRLGIVTLVPPDTRSEVINISIPVGELITRAAQAVSDARHRHAERKAGERVMRRLQDFKARSADATVDR